MKTYVGQRLMVMLMALALAPLLTSTMAYSQSNTNRPGGDYRDFNLQPSIAGFGPCESACKNDSRCKSWTYVRPGIQGSKARCWLKSSVPPARASNCCTSGVKARPVFTTKRKRVNGTRCGNKGGVWRNGLCIGGGF